MTNNNLNYAALISAIQSKMNPQSLDISGIEGIYDAYQTGRKNTYERQKEENDLQLQQQRQNYNNAVLQDTQLDVDRKKWMFDQMQNASDTQGVGGGTFSGSASGGNALWRDGRSVRQKELENLMSLGKPVDEVMRYVYPTERSQTGTRFLAGQSGGTDDLITPTIQGMSGGDFFNPMRGMNPSLDTESTAAEAILSSRSWPESITRASSSYGKPLNTGNYPFGVPPTTAPASFMNQMQANGNGSPVGQVREGLSGLTGSPSYNSDSLNGSGLGFDAGTGLGDGMNKILNGESGNGSGLSFDAGTGLGDGMNKILNGESGLGTGQENSYLSGGFGQKKSVFGKNMLDSFSHKNPWRFL